MWAVMPNLPCQEIEMMGQKYLAYLKIVPVKASRNAPCKTTVRAFIKKIYAHEK